MTSTDMLALVLICVAAVLETALCVMICAILYAAALKTAVNREDSSKKGE